MARQPDIHERIKTHLWEVAAHLGQSRPEERADILYSLETQIYEALATRVPEGKPTADDLKAVLAALPLPESYGPVDERSEPMMLGESGMRLGSVDLQERLAVASLVPRNCTEAYGGLTLAIIALALLFCGLALISYGEVYTRLATASNAATPPMTSGIQTFGLIGCVLLFISLICLITASYMGKSAITEIRQSGWRMRGLWAAVIARLSFVLTLFNGVIYAVLFAFFYFAGEPTSDLHLTTAFVVRHLLLAMVLLGIDALILRTEWRNVRQEATPSPEVHLPSPRQ